MKTDDEKLIAYFALGEGGDFKEHFFSIAMLRRLLGKIERNHDLVERIRAHAGMKAKEREEGRRYMEDAPYLLEVLEYIDEPSVTRKYLLSAQIISAVETVLMGRDIGDLNLIPTVRELQGRRAQSKGRIRRHRQFRS